MAELKKAPWSDWETVRLIGRGSFGTVYEIQRELVDGDIETAALKVITIPQNPGDVEELLSEGYDDESVTAAFSSHLKSIISEYSLMRKMDGSANIVNCKDIRYIQHDDGIGWDIYIRMELLTPLIKALPVDVSEDTVIQIGRDICNALVLCKKHGIIHRDIKPQNIFVSANGDYKLGDFGIAKTIEKTMGGTKIGTYKYMAPEVYNNQPYGYGADIYSLGLVLYWLLNERRMPFVPLPPAKLKAEQDEESRYRRMSGELLPPPAHGSDELKRIVLKACAYAPKDRYSTAAGMLEDLNGVGGSDVALYSVSYNVQKDGSVETPSYSDEEQQSTCVLFNETDGTVALGFGQKTGTELGLKSDRSRPNSVRRGNMMHISAQRISMQENDMMIGRSLDNARTTNSETVSDSAKCATDDVLFKNKSVTTKECNEKTKENTRKKRTIGLLLLTIIGIGIIAAISILGLSNNNDITGVANNTEVLTKDAMNKSDDEDETKVSAYEIEIVMLLDQPNGSIYDGSICDAIWDGIKAFCDETGATCDYMAPTEEYAYLSLIDQAVAAGGKVLVCPGYLFEDAVFEAQDKYPEVKFILIDGRPHSTDYTEFRTGDNVYSVLFAEQEAGFMAGYASVMEGYRNLAFFGGMAVTSVARFGYGYVAGAEQAAKDLGLNPGEVNLIYWYSGDFMPSPEKLTTVKGWYETGTEVIFSCDESLCENAFMAAEELGKATIGVDLDQAKDSSSVITSAMKGYANATYDALVRNKNGNFPGGQDAILGSAVDCVGLATGDSWKLVNYTEEQYQELYDRLKNDVDGIASSIPTDTDIADPTEIPLKYVNLYYK